MEDDRLREGWTEVVQAEDLDGHMMEIGQAEANANLVQEMLQFFKLTSLWVAGCGTGQIFELLDPKSLENVAVTLTDINPSFLEIAKKRALEIIKPDFKAFVDDLENPETKGSYDAALVVLVLEHVDWKKAVAALCEQVNQTVCVIIQEQDQNASMVAKDRVLKPSIQKFIETSKPHLVDQSELTDEMSSHGFSLNHKLEKPVPDGKKMVGMVFSRNH